MCRTLSLTYIAHRTIAVGREKYSAGDYVLLHGTKGEFICRLTGFVKNMTDGQATADIEWLYWPEEMAREIRNIPVKKRPTIPKCAAGEVFLSNCKDSVGIECIACKVQITPLALSSPIPQHHKQNQLYAHWQWNITSKQFTPVKQERRKGFLSAVVETVTLEGTEEKSQRRNQSRVPSGKFGSDRAPDKALARELSINLSRSPAGKRFLATNSNQDPPAVPNTSSPLSSLRCEGSGTRLKSKSVPQKPVSSSTKRPEQITKWNSSSNVCTHKSNAELKTRCDQSAIDEQPLPLTPVVGTRRERKRTGAREAGVKHVKRQSQFNTCDVIDLLNTDEEDDGDKDEEDELVECDQNKGISEQGRCYTKEGESSHDSTEVQVPEVAKPMTGGEERELDCNQYSMDDEVKTPARRGGRGKEVGRSNGSTTQIPEDILSPPMNASTESVAPAGKKWSLRSKADVKPPAYLAACPSILGAASGTKPNEERRVFTRKERKRERSTSPLPDLLVEEPLGKKFKQSGQKGMISTDVPKLKRGKKRWERDSEENVSESEVVMKTPQRKVCSPRPHTIPRRKKRRAAVVEDHPIHADCDESDNDKIITLERNVGKKSERGRNLTQKKSRNQSKRVGRRSLYKTKCREDLDDDMGTGDEYQPSSDGESSDSTDSREEEEEEEEEKDDSFTTSSQKKSSRKVLTRAIASVDNWSPEIDVKFHTGSTTSKVTKTPKTPRVSKISKTPRTTPSVKPPRSRVVVTPQIPQKKTKAGKVKRSDFDKARLR